MSTVVINIHNHTHNPSLAVIAKRVIAGLERDKQLERGLTSTTKPLESEAVLPLTSVKTGRHAELELFVKGLSPTEKEILSRLIGKKPAVKVAKSSIDLSVYDKVR